MDTQVLKIRLLDPGESPPEHLDPGSNCQKCGKNEAESQKFAGYFEIEGIKYTDICKGCSKGHVRTVYVEID